MHYNRVPCPKRYLHPMLPFTRTEPYAISLKNISFHTVSNHTAAIPH